MIKSTLKNKLENMKKCIKKWDDQPKNDVFLINLCNFLIPGNQNQRK